MLYVTGITGHTGKYLVEKLIKENYKGKIRCAVRPNSDTSIIDNSGLNIEKVVDDLSDIEFLKESMKDIETVLHIVHINKSENVLDAAIYNGVKWAIMVHTTGRYSKYKSASSEYIKIEDNVLSNRDKIGITILRPTMIYGSHRDQNMYRLIDYLNRHKFFPIFGNGKNLMQPVSAKDLGEAYYSVLINRDKTYNKEYNLSGGSPLEYINLCRTITNILNKKTSYIFIPLQLSVLLAKIYNTLFKKALISVEQVLRMQEDKIFDHKNATLDFGYHPATFEKGVSKEINEYLLKQTITQ